MTNIKRHYQLKNIGDFFAPLQQIEYEQSGFCNLDCQYCLYPKDKKIMQNLNKDVVKQILENQYYNQQVEQFKGNEDQLDQVSLFGTEPTLNTYQYLRQNFFEKFIKHFSKLKKFQISTNLINNQDKIKSIIIELQRLSKEYNREIILDLQLSIDGSEEINNKNRGEGMHKQIYETYVKLINFIKNKEFQDILLNSNLSINMHFKPTYDVQDIQNFYQDIGFFEKQIQFFNHLQEVYFNQLRSIENIRNRIKQNKMFQLSNVFGFTLQLSGIYTKESGKQLQQLQKWVMRNSKVLSEKYRFIVVEAPFYYHRFENFIKYIWSNQVQRQENQENIYKFKNNYRLDGCSQQKTMLVIQQDGSLLLCNVAHYMRDEKYRKEFFNRSYFSHSMREKEIFIPSLIINKDSELLDVIKMIYQNQSTYYQFNFQQQMIKQLVLTLQQQNELEDKLLVQDEIYLNLFQLFLQTQSACVQQYRLETGTGFVPPISIIHAFGNGLFRLIFEKKFMELKERKKLQ